VADAHSTEGRLVENAVCAAAYLEDRLAAAGPADRAIQADPAVVAELRLLEAGYLRAGVGRLGGWAASARVGRAQAASSSLEANTSEGPETRMSQRQCKREVAAALPVL
jgi:hypothetical protein